MEPATFQLVKAEVCDLTMELAQEFHALEPSPTERTLNQSRLRMLREKATAKQLITFSWAKALFNDRWIRVNGQHSSQVLVELDGDFPTGLKVHLDQYQVADAQGLALLFRQFDDRKSGRSSTDVAGAYQNIEPDLQDVRRDVGKLAIEGVTYYNDKVEGRSTKKGDDQYSLFHEVILHDYIKWAGEIFSVKTPELRSRPVMGAMYASFLADEEEARRFWLEVSRGGDPHGSDNAPSTVLDEWLKALKDKNERTNKVPPFQVYQACIYAYNTFHKGLPLNKVKYEFKTPLEPIPKAA
jgi:hypothetical protein